MINVSVYRNHNTVVRVRVEGHAGFGRFGKDIVCSAVSILTTTTVNALESFTDDHFICDVDPKGGMIDIKIAGDVSDQANLLLNTLILGLQSIEDEYGKKYITITNLEEV